VRLLFLSPVPPHPPDSGARIRMGALVRGLTERHTVDVLTLGAGTADREAAAELESFGVKVELVEHVPGRGRAMLGALRKSRSLYFELHDSPAMRRAVRARLEFGRYDVVLAEFAYMGQYRVAHPVPWVLDQHNVEFALNQSLGRIATGARGLAYRAHSRREFFLRRTEELSACMAVDHVVTVSQTDADLLRSELPSLAPTVVPNGVDLERYALAAPPSGTAHAVFVGKMDYRPNIDAMQWFCDEILPLVQRRVPEFTLSIVGQNPVSAVQKLAHREGVDVTGRVPDTRPFIAAANAVVVPLRAGSGTRLKVLEGMAMGRPVVTTGVGCEGIDVVRGRHIAVAESAPEFADTLARVLNDPSLIASLAREGRDLVERRYSWRASVDLMEGVLARVTHEAAAKPVGLET